MRERITKYSKISKFIDIPKVSSKHVGKTYRSIAKEDVALKTLYGMAFVL